MLKKLTFKVHYPIDENKEEFERRFAKACAQILIDKYPPDVIDQVIEKLRRQ